MSEATYPDAIVTDGRITDIKTGLELPSYSGLVLANLAGRYAVMFTTVKPNGRDWEIVHWGATLSTTEIQKFLKGK